MFRLALLLFFVMGASVAGAVVIAALMAGFDTQAPIVLAAWVGFVAARPIRWMVARQFS